MQFFDAAATRAPLVFDRLIPALRAAFAAGASVPPRHVHTVAAGGAQGTVLIMPAWSEDGFLGIKTIAIFPGNSALGLPGLHATYVLYDARTGVPLAQMDGNEITAHRTAAASALGASLLARENASTLLVLGTGRVARLLPAAHASVRPIRQVLVWNHHAAGARALAAEWRAAGWNAQAVEPDGEHGEGSEGGDGTGLALAVRSADIVSCATLSSEPLVRGEWLSPGTHLDLIGSFMPSMKEAAASCFDGSSVFVDTDEALLKSGDLLDAIAAGTLRAAEVRATLEQLCRGEHPGRVSDHERTVLKAVGSALEDLTAARLVWQARADADPTAIYSQPGRS